MGRKNKRIGESRFWAREAGIDGLARLFDEIGTKPAIEEVNQELEQSEMTQTEVISQKLAEETFKESLKVEGEISVKKRIQSANDYPENAIIMSIGPSSSGKTTFLRKVFNEKGVFSYWDLFYQEKEEKQIKEMDQETKRRIKRRYFSMISNALKSEKSGKIIVDANCLDIEIRKTIYEIAQRSQRPLFVITQCATLEETRRNINKRYKGMPNAVEKRRKGREAAESTMEVFKRVHPKLEKELSQYGLVLEDYEGQILDVIHMGENKKTKKERSRD